MAPSVSGTCEIPSSRSESVFSEDVDRMYVEYDDPGRYMQVRRARKTYQGIHIKISQLQSIECSGETKKSKNYYFRDKKLIFGPCSLCCV